MAGTIGRAFKISDKQAQGYGYARPGMRRNGGVTAIAAINGRGSARAAMSGRSRAARLGHARNVTRGALTATEKAAFAKKMREARVHAPNSGSGRASASRRTWAARLKKNRRRVSGTESPGPKPGANNRRTRMASRKKTAKKRPSRRLRKRPAKRRTRRAAAAPKRRRKRRKASSKRAAAPKRRKRRKSRRKATTKRRAAPRRRKRRKASSKRRAAPKRRKRRKSRRKASKRRMSPNRRRRRRAKSRRRATPNRRRRRRGKSRRRATPNRRRRSRRAKSRRRSTPNRRRRGKSRRRNGRGGRGRRSAFRRNEGMLTTLKDALKVGAIALAGLAVHRVAAKLLSDVVLTRVIGAPAVAPPAVAGLEMLQPYKGLIASAASAAIGIFATVKLVKDPDTRKYLIGGVAGSFLLSALIDVLKGFGGSSGAQVASYLSGYDQGTAESLGASIMPHYAPIGEYFDGQLGEYFESGMSGLGNYGGNPDIYQAAAGVGAMPSLNTAHVDPSSDLDRELTLAEAAAGVGAASYEAAAGMGLGEFLGGGGRSLPAASTWVPGTSRPDIWAPVTGVNKPQAATAQTAAGILQTGGGGGVFG